MKTHYTFVVIGLMAFALGMSAEAWAGGNPPPPACLDESVNGSTIRGTVTVATSNYDGVTADIDATLRLSSKGNERVFRAHAAGVSVFSSEHMMCDVLAANPTEQDSGQNMTILQAFGSSATTIKINSKSMSGTNWNPVPGVPGHQTGIAEATLYPQ